VERAFRSLKTVDLHVRPSTIANPIASALISFSVCWLTTWSGTCVRIWRPFCLTMRTRSQRKNSAPRWSRRPSAPLSSSPGPHQSALRTICRAQFSDSSRRPRHDHLQRVRPKDAAPRLLISSPSPRLSSDAPRSPPGIFVSLVSLRNVVSKPTCISSQLPYNQALPF